MDLARSALKHRHDELRALPEKSRPPEHPGASAARFVATTNLARHLSEVIDQLDAALAGDPDEDGMRWVVETIRYGHMLVMGSPAAVGFLRELPNHRIDHLLRHAHIATSPENRAKVRAMLGVPTNER